MKMKSLILIIIALGCGLVASIGISQVMDVGGNGGTIKMEQILVAKGEINIGDKLDANSVQLEEWPAAKIPEGVGRKLEDVEGKFAQVRFYKGEPILQAKISDRNGNKMDGIPKGYRTSTIKVDEDTVMEGIGPGDRVDVMVFLKRGEDIRQTGVFPILRNVRVFSKGAQTERVVDEKGQAARARTISLLVKPDQAAQIALATQMGKISLALRNPNDDPKNDKEQVIDMNEILNGKSENADDSKKESDNTAGFLGMVQGALKGQPSGTAGQPGVEPVEPAKVPEFKMVMLTPTEVKTFEWADRNALPIESSISSGSGNASPTNAPVKGTLVPSTPPVPAEPDSTDADTADSGKP